MKVQLFIILLILLVVLTSCSGNSDLVPIYDGFGEPSSGNVGLAINPPNVSDNLSNSSDIVSPNETS